MPPTMRVPVIRADFTSDAVWEDLKEEIDSPTEEGFLANVEFVEDRGLVGLDEATITGLMPRSYPHECQHPVAFVVDVTTVFTSDHPLLVIDLHENHAVRAFRALPRQVQAIENNLSIANMDFADFADAAGPDGVFRGF